MLAALKRLERTQRLVEDDEAFLQALMTAFEQGIVPAKTSKSLKEAIEKAQSLDAVRIVTLARSMIPSTLLTPQPVTMLAETPQEVILSAYLVQPG